MKIVDLDGYAANPGDLSWEAFEQLGDLVVYDNTSQEQIIERAKDAEILLVNKIELNKDIISQLPKLKYIGELATGFNNIDIAAAKEKGIVVTNIPAYSTDSVAQFVFAHLLNIATHVDYYSQKPEREFGAVRTYSVIGTSP